MQIIIKLASGQAGPLADPAAVRSFLAELEATHQVRSRSAKAHHTVVEIETFTVVADVRELEYLREPPRAGS